MSMTVPVMHRQLLLSRVVGLTNPITEHSRAQIYHALLQFLIWHAPQTVQCVNGVSAPHTTHESVVELLTTRGVQRCLGRAGLHDRTTEESLTITLVGDNLTTNTDTTGALTPSGFGNRERRAARIKR